MRYLHTSHRPLHAVHAPGGCVLWSKTAHMGVRCVKSLTGVPVSGALSVAECSAAGNGKPARLAVGVHIRERVCLEP